jgi:hypothetical protein
VGSSVTSIPGTVSVARGSDAHEALITFTPFGALTIGGTYTMMVKGSSPGGSISDSTTTFVLQDTATPEVSNIQVLSSIGGTPVSIYPQSGPVTINNSATQIWLTLAIPFTSTNSIKWDSCAISLVPVVNGVDQSALPVKRLTTGTPNDNVIRFQISSPIYTAGTYKVQVIAVSQDSAGNTFTGPDSTFSAPLFNILTNNNVISVFLQDPYASSGSNLVLQMIKPLTVNSTQGAVTVPENIRAGYPSTVASAPTGYAPLVVGSGANQGLAYTMQFFQGLTGLTGLTFNSTSPTTVNMYYYGTDVPSGISQSALALYGYMSGAWVRMSPSTNIGSIDINNYTLSLASTDVLPDYLGIFYPLNVGNVTPTAVPTAIPFNSTRSFNPGHADPVHRKARIYYSEVMVAEVEAKVYNVGGVLIRTLTSGSGSVNLGQFTRDAAYNANRYYFEWDGANDSGTTVKNGIYVVVTRVKLRDGSTKTLKTPLALIK